MAVSCHGSGLGDFEQLCPALQEQLTRFEIGGGAVTAIVDDECVAQFWAGEGKTGSSLDGQHHRRCRFGDQGADGNGRPAPGRLR